MYPPDGLIAVPESWGAVKEAPHPEAARLFVDGVIGQPGQNAYGQDLMYNSLRTDVAPPPDNDIVRSLDAPQVRG